jgi:calcium-dependent protein kinase
VQISEAAKDLISKMLCPEEKRLTAKEVLEHPFLTNAFKRHSVLESGLDNKNRLLASLKEFNNSKLIQRIIFTALSQRLSYTELENLKDIFNQMDKNNDGEVNHMEFTQGLQFLKLTDQSNEEIKKLFQLMDTNKDQKINYSEFIAATIDKKFYTNQERLLEVFESLDTSKDGKISFSEFRAVINSNKNFRDDSFEILKKEFQEVDLNQDGTIDYEEFVQIISKKKDQILPKKDSNEM